MHLGVFIMNALQITTSKYISTCNLVLEFSALMMAFTYNNHVIVCVCVCISILINFKIILI